jgi:hypothetical protein
MLINWAVVFLAQNQLRCGGHHPTQWCPRPVTSAQLQHLGAFVLELICILFVKSPTAFSSELKRCFPPSRAGNTVSNSLLPLYEGITATVPGPGSARCISHPRYHSHGLQAVCHARLLVAVRARAIALRWQGGCIASVLRPSSVEELWSHTGPAIYVQLE